MRTLALVSIVVLAFLPIEVLLLARVWAQVTSQPMDTPEAERLFSLTDDLASPYAPIAGGPPLRTTGVVDYTVLIAIEAYFIAMLAAIVAIVMAGSVWAWLARHRTRKPPAWVKKINTRQEERRIWQPRSGTRYGRIYVTLRLQPQYPLHRKAGLGPP